MEGKNMKKKIIFLLILFVSIISLVGCGKKENTEGTRKPTASSKAFKNDYEALNGKENKSGKVIVLSQFQKLTQCKKLLLLNY